MPAARGALSRQRGVLALLDASHEGLALRVIKDRMAGHVTEWEIKGDLALLKQLGLIELSGNCNQAAQAVDV